VHRKNHGQAAHKTSVTIAIFIPNPLNYQVIREKNAENCSIEHRRPTAQPSSDVGENRPIPPNLPAWMR
jgi:hypothetical protein